MCLCQEDAAKYISTKAFELNGKSSIADAAYNDVVKCYDGLAVEPLFVELDDVHLVDFLLGLAVLVNGQALATHSYMLLAVNGSGQFTNSLTKSLVTEFVLLRGGCWHRCKNNGGTRCAILLPHALCRHLSHLFMGYSVLESVHSSSISNLFLTNIADTFGEILAEPSLRFRQLLSDAFFYLCHTL